MPRFKFIVLTNAVAGAEDAYNDWYTNQHLSDVLRAPGFVAAQRFEIAPEGSVSEFRYLAIYDIETDDVQATLENMMRHAGTEKMPLSPALAERYSAITYKEITPLKVI